MAPFIRWPETVCFTAESINIDNEKKEFFTRKELPVYGVAPDGSPPLGILHPIYHDSG